MRKSEQFLFYCVVFISFLSAFLLRLKGITFGLPMITHPNEPFIFDTALNMIHLKDFCPHFSLDPAHKMYNFFMYPTFYIYMQSFLYFVLMKIFSLTHGDPYRLVTVLLSWGRVLTVIFACGTIFLTFLISKKMFSKTAAIFSLLFISFSLMHVKNSFLVTVDTPMTFWVMASFLMSFLIYSGKRRRLYYILNGVFIGFAVGTKYTAALCVVPFVLADFLSGERFAKGRKKAVNKDLIIGVLTVLISFLVTSPYILVHFKYFYNALSVLQSGYSGAHLGEGSVAGNSFMYYFYAATKGYGPVPFLVAFFGILLLSLEDYRKTFILLSYPLLYFLLVGSYSVHHSYTIVSIIPFLSIFGGYCAQKMFSYIKKRPLSKVTQNMLVAILAAILVGGILAEACKSYAYVRKVTLKDTRNMAALWIRDNIVQGSVIAKEFYTPQLETSRYEVVSLFYHGLISHDLSQYDYFISSSKDYLRFFKEPERYKKEVDQYNYIFSHYQLLKEFVSDEKTTTGPTIRIYRGR